MGSRFLIFKSDKDDTSNEVEFLGGVLTQQAKFFGPWSDEYLKTLPSEMAEGLKELSPPDDKRIPFMAVARHIGDMPSDFVALVCEAMNLDPAKRPTPAEALHLYEWLGGSRDNQG